MPIPKKNIGEILDVIEKWVPDRSTRSALLTDLRGTTAFDRNLSFAATVNRLIDEHVHRWGKEMK